MKTLIYGAGPIGRWLALRLKQAGRDVTLLARNETLRTLDQKGIEIVDALTGERYTARVPLVERLDPDDRYDLVVVAMIRSSRLAVCPMLARNTSLRSILFLGNDVSGFRRYLDFLPKDKVMLGFPGAGGGWNGEDLVMSDRDKPGDRAQVFLGELDGQTRERTLEIGRLFETTNIKVRLEKDMDGWLKYHFAFIGPTAGAIFKHGGDTRAVATDRDTLHQYCRACRQAGDVLRAVGYRKRQPGVFNLFYWVPRWLEPKVFRKLFASRRAEIAFGLHARTVGPELLELAEEFAMLQAESRIETPDLDALLAHVPRPPGASESKELSS